MKVSTEKELKLAEVLVNLKDQNRGMRIGEMLFRRIARRQEKIYKSQKSN